ncbi:hypothetical protein [Paenibacillus sp. Leaf72]|uniref:hypothetical protein n=1 Tax=Paenibacillus sp. Leaf72 TaxID=1736234 RepID=UPI000713F846|nr:hypothetical protein [Paenibacillus sp. Leaf72]KQN99979.1 hypothetical protein ASF12_17535 [Paenibacillus sp. Leaf72]
MIPISGRPEREAIAASFFGYRIWFYPFAAVLLNPLPCAKVSFTALSAITDTNKGLLSGALQQGLWQAGDKVE